MKRPILYILLAVLALTAPEATAGIGAVGNPSDPNKPVAHRRHILVDTLPARAKGPYKFGNMRNYRIAWRLIPIYPEPTAAAPNGKAPATGEASNPAAADTKKEDSKFGRFWKSIPGLSGVPGLR